MEIVTQHFRLNVKHYSRTAHKQYETSNKLKLPPIFFFLYGTYILLTQNFTTLMHVFWAKRGWDLPILPNVVHLETI